jgi:uncharacterized protein (DUF2147 family)
MRRMLQRYRALIAVAVVMGVLVGAPASALARSTIEGTWITPQKAEVTIAPCGDAYCGTLSWIVIPDENAAACEMNQDAFALQMVDFQNPDPTLRARALVGMEILTLRVQGTGTFEGSIYNAQDGQSYAGVVSVLGPDTIELGNGCAFGMCIMTQEWRRVATRLEAPGFTCRSN